MWIVELVDNIFDNGLDDMVDVVDRCCGGCVCFWLFLCICCILCYVVFLSFMCCILFFNFIVFIVFVGGIFYFNQFCEGLIDVCVESLLMQGEIILGVIVVFVLVDINLIIIDLQKFFELQVGQSIMLVLNDEDFEFLIVLQCVVLVLCCLILLMWICVCIYDVDVNLIFDFKYFYIGVQVLCFDLLLFQGEFLIWIDWIVNFFNWLLQQSDFFVYKELFGGDGLIYLEVMNVLIGVCGVVVCIIDDGELIVLVVVFVQCFCVVFGVFLFFMQVGDIDKIVYVECFVILCVFGVVIFVNVIVLLLFFLIIVMLL